MGDTQVEQEKNSWGKINLTLVLCQETNLNIFRHIFHFYEFTANNYFNGHNCGSGCFFPKMKSNN